MIFVYIIDLIHFRHSGLITCRQIFPHCTENEPDASGMHCIYEVPKYNKSAALWLLAVQERHPARVALGSLIQVTQNLPALLLLPSASPGRINLLFNTCSLATCFSLKHWYFS